MSKIKRFDREEALKAEAEAYLKRLRNRIEERESLRRAQQDRQQVAQKEAKVYLGLLFERAALRDALRTRRAKRWRVESKDLLKRAELYRKRLRTYLNPELQDKKSEAMISSDLLGKGYQSVVFMPEETSEHDLSPAGAQSPLDLLNKFHALSMAGDPQPSGSDLSAEGSMIFNQSIFVPVEFEEIEAINVHNQNNSSAACRPDASGRA